MNAKLPMAATYFPFDMGSYKVAAGLNALDHDFGNGRQDTIVFQFDEEFPDFRDSMKRIRADALDRYWDESRCAPPVMAAVLEWLVQQLVLEHPEKFRLNTDTSGQVLECLLSGDSISFDEQYRLRSSSGEFRSLFDALAAQVQEDLAVVEVARGGDCLVAAHVCAPSHWDPRSKLGGDFAAVHAPVPHMETLKRQAGSLTQTLAGDLRYQRFGWGLVSSRQLDHHPEPPNSFTGTTSDWHGRSFDAQAPRLYARVERQVLIGLPKVSAFLFTIHPYHYDCATLSREHRLALASAVESMDDAARAYKGLCDSADAIIQWLREMDSDG